jgi:two-component system chemotaxis response regulator CheB
VTKGPKENRFRPSIDALFRSAASSYGAKTIGVVLSGALDDGTSGLWSVKRMGGVAVIQHPDDARFESMPKSALEYVEPDYTMPAAEIGQLLVRLINEAHGEGVPVEEEVKTRMEKEVAIAQEGNAFQKGFMQLGQLSPYTCPECHGALVRVIEGRMARFRCHTGHAYSDNALLESVMHSTGEQLWQVMRSLEEGVMLLKEMAQSVADRGEKDRAALFHKKAHELEKRSRTVHAAVLQHESLSGDNLGMSVPGA